jgi:PPOX class probable F420-dependent enzyme
MSGRSGVLLGRRLVPLYEWLRKSEATLEGVPASVSNSVRYLDGAEYLLLESERANGERVAIQKRIFLHTEAGSGKVRRISRQPIVRVAACTVRGVAFGDSIVCVARIVPAEQEAQAEAALRRQYGLRWRLFTWLIHHEHAYLELTPLVEQEPVPAARARWRASRPSVQRGAGGR